MSPAATTAGSQKRRLRQSGTISPGGGTGSVLTVAEIEPALLVFLSVQVMG